MVLGLCVPQSQAEKRDHSRCDQARCHIDDFNATSKSPNEVMTILRLTKIATVVAVRMTLIAFGRGFNPERARKIGSPSNAR